MDAKARSTLYRKWRKEEDEWLESEGMCRVTYITPKKNYMKLCKRCNVSKENTEFNKVEANDKHR